MPATGHRMSEAQRKALSVKMKAIYAAKKAAKVEGELIPLDAVAVTAERGAARKPQAQKRSQSLVRLAQLIVAVWTVIENDK